MDNSQKQSYSGITGRKCFQFSKDIQQGIVTVDLELRREFGSGDLVVLDSKMMLMLWE